MPLSQQVDGVLPNRLPFQAVHECPDVVLAFHSVEPVLIAGRSCWPLLIDGLAGPALHGELVQLGVRAGDEVGGAQSVLLLRAQ